MKKEIENTRKWRLISHNKYVKANNNGISTATDATITFYVHDEIIGKCIILCNTYKYTIMTTNSNIRSKALYMTIIYLYMYVKLSTRTFMAKRNMSFIGKLTSIMLHIYSLLYSCYALTFKTYTRHGNLFKMLHSTSYAFISKQLIILQTWFISGISLSSWVIILPVVCLHNYALSQA